MLKTFVEEQVAERGYGTSSEYVRELIRRERDRTYLKGILVAGGSTPAGIRAVAEYFDSLRSTIRGPSAE